MSPVPQNSIGYSSKDMSMDACILAGMRRPRSCHYGKVFFYVCNNNNQSKSTAAAQAAIKLQPIKTVGGGGESARERQKCCQKLLTTQEVRTHAICL